MEALMQFVEDRAIVYESGIHLTHFAFDCEHNSVFLTMPLTAFVYDYFIYNSLYSVDWDKSRGEGQVVEINIKEAVGAKLTYKPKFCSISRP